MLTLLLRARRIDRSQAAGHEDHSLLRCGFLLEELVSV
jgi:hypothetical protein